jgi:hypothetical protein
MTHGFWKITALSAALLLSAANTSAYAASVGVGVGGATASGSVDNSGASVGANDSATATVGSRPTRMEQIGKARRGLALV